MVSPNATEADWYRSYWLDEALALEPNGTQPEAVLEGAVKADVCIVGGGFTGLWTALALKEHEPSMDVVLLEADLCGSGASGRNGGFAMSWWSKYSTLKKLYGVDSALELAAMSSDAISSIGSFCIDNNIDAQFREDGWLWTATNPSQIGAWRNTVDELAAVGAHPFKELSADEAADRSGSEAHLQAIYEARAASVQPGLLVRGLRRVAIERGVDIYERSPMVRLMRSRPPAVETRVGRVDADVVILALNAWAGGVRELSRSLAVVSSDLIATSKVPDRLSEIGWATGVCISDSRLLAHYYRTTVDGRVVFGKSIARLAYGNRINSAAFHGVSPQADVVAAGFRRTYPELADVSVYKSWTGPVDRPIYGVPSFSGLGGRPDILYGAGYSGTGVAQSVIGGRILASLALQLDDRWAHSPLTRGFEGTYPPEPIRFAGGSVIRAAVYRKEAAEDADCAVGYLTDRVTRLAPAGLVPVRPRNASGQ